MSPGALSVFQCNNTRGYICSASARDAHLLHHQQWRLPQPNSLATTLVGSIQICSRGENNA